MPEPWLFADDLSTRLGGVKDTVYTWASEKVVLAHKAGRLWKFQASETDDWARRCDAASRDDAEPG